MEISNAPLTTSRIDPMDKSTPLDKLYAIEGRDAERLAEVGRLMYERDEEPWHVQHVARLALNLFDQTHDLHQLESRHRFWLLCAALLHDIGWSLSPDGSKHHKFSLKLIVSHGWKNFHGTEIAIIGNVARYHRKSLPSKKHGSFAILDRDEKSVVEKLAALVRLADSLDRGHVQRVEDVRVITAPKIITLQVRSASHWDAEAGAVTRKKDLAEQVFKRQIQTAAWPGVT